MATHLSVLAWEIPWTEEPGRLQYMGFQRVGHNWACIHIHSFLISHQKFFSPSVWEIHLRKSSGAGVISTCTLVSMLIMCQLCMIPGTCLALSSLVSSSLKWKSSNKNDYNNYPTGTTKRVFWNSSASWHPVLLDGLPPPSLSPIQKHPSTLYEKWQSMQRMKPWLSATQLQWNREKFKWTLVEPNRLTSPSTF